MILNVHPDSDGSASVEIYGPWGNEMCSVEHSECNFEQACVYLSNLTHATTLTFQESDFGHMSNQQLNLFFASVSKLRELKIINFLDIAEYWPESKPVSLLEFLSIALMNHRNTIETLSITPQPHRAVEIQANDNRIIEYATFINSFKNLKNLYLNLHDKWSEMHLSKLLDRLNHTGLKYLGLDCIPSFFDSGSLSSPSVNFCNALKKHTALKSIELSSCARDDDDEYEDTYNTKANNNMNEFCKAVKLHGDIESLSFFCLDYDPMHDKSIKHLYNLITSAGGTKISKEKFHINNTDDEQDEQIDDAFCHQRASNAILILRSAQEKRRLSSRSSIRDLPKDMAFLVAKMLFKPRYY